MVSFFFMEINLDKNGCLIIDSIDFKNFALHPLWLRERINSAKYLDQNNFAKISIIFILYFIFFLGSLTRKLSIISTIFLFYFILILYLTNSLLVYVEYNSSQKKNIEKFQTNVSTQQYKLKFRKSVSYRP